MDGVEPGPRAFDARRQADDALSTSGSPPDHAGHASPLLGARGRLVNNRRRSSLSTPSFLAGRAHGLCAGHAKPQSVMGSAEEALLATATGEKVAFAAAAKSTIAGVFSHNGEFFASTHGDHTVKVTEFDTGRPLVVFRGHPRTPWTVKFHPRSNSLLASGCLGGEVRIWHLETRECVYHHHFDDPVGSLDFYPDGEVLAIASGCNVFTWAYSRMEAPKLLLTKKEPVRFVSFHPQGRYMLIGVTNKLDDTSTVGGDGLVVLGDRAVAIRRRHGTLLPGAQELASSRTRSATPLSITPHSPNMVGSPAIVGHSLSGVNMSPQMTTIVPPSRERVPPPPPTSTRLRPAPVTGAPAPPPPSAFMVAPAAVQYGMPGTGLGLLSLSGDVAMGEATPTTPITPATPLTPITPPAAAPLPVTPTSASAGGSFPAARHSPPPAPRRRRPRSPTEDAEDEPAAQRPRLDHGGIIPMVTVDITMHAPRRDGAQANNNAATAPRPNDFRLHANTTADGAMRVEVTGRPPVNVMPAEHMRPQTYQTMSLEVYDFVAHDEVPLLCIPHAILHSDAGCQFSPCGRYLASCVVATHQQGRPMVFKLALYSMREADVGRLLSSTPIEGDKITVVRFSPASAHLMAGFAMRRTFLSEFYDNARQRPMCDVLASYRISDMSLVSVLQLPCTNEPCSSVNMAAFHPVPGAGFAYGTDKGSLWLFRRPSPMPTDSSHVTMSRQGGHGAMLDQRMYEINRSERRRNMHLARRAHLIPAPYVAEPSPVITTTTTTTAVPAAPGVAAGSVSPPDLADVMDFLTDPNARAAASRPVPGRAQQASPSDQASPRIINGQPPEGSAGFKPRPRDRSEL